MPINTGKTLNNVLAFFAIVICMIACRSASSVPAGIIELNSMKEIMWDVAQIEAYANLYIAGDSTKKVKPATLALYQKIFALHKTTKEKFAASISYYQSHPPQHKILLDSLVQYATRMKEKDQQKRYSKPLSVAK